MKVKVSKQWIIDTINAALAAGKLEPGVWTNSNYSRPGDMRYRDRNKSRGDAQLTACTACAVGNIFLSAISEPLDGWVDDSDDPTAERRVVSAVDFWINRVINKEVHDYDSYEPGVPDYPRSTTLLDTLDFALAKKHYLQALSCAFEGTYTAQYDYTRDHARSVAAAAADTCAMVQERFPEYIILDLNGFTPQPGLEIVDE